MDYFTSVAYRLDQQRAVNLARDHEDLRRQAERATAVGGLVLEPSPAPPSAQPARRLRGSWARLRAFAHLGHPLPH